MSSEVLLQQPDPHGGVRSGAGFLAAAFTNLPGFLKSVSETPLPIPIILNAAATGGIPKILLNRELPAAKGRDAAAIRRAMVTYFALPRKISKSRVRRDFFLYCSIKSLPIRRYLARVETLPMTVLAMLPSSEITPAMPDIQVGLTAAA